MQRYLKFFTVFVFCLVCLLSFNIASAAYGDVSTYISKIYAGDGGAATGAYLDFAEDVAFDSAGNMYIADTYNNVVRKIDISGKITTFAGTGSYGDTDGASNQAEFAIPQGIAVEGNGTVYLADTYNHKIKKIAGGNVTTIATGLLYPSGLALYGDTLYISDTGNNAIKKVSKNGGSVSVVSTNVTVPEKITPSSDGGFLYVADSAEHKVKKINVGSGAAEVIAGSGNNSYAEGTGAGASFQNVVGVTLDSGTNTLYVTDGDGYNDKLRKINLATKTTSLLASDANMTTLNFPKGVALKGSYAYVANSGIGTVHRFNKSSGSAEHIAGKQRFGNTDGAKNDVVLGRPFKMATADGNKMYVAQNNLIKQIDLGSGNTSHVIGSVVDAYREGAGDRVRFSTISGLTIDAAGKNLYLADHWNNRIRKIDLATKTASLVSGTGLTNCTGSCNGYADGTRDTAKFDSPSDVAISPDSQYLYVTDTSNNRVRKVRISDGQTWLLAGSGAPGFADGTGGSAAFNRPYGLAIDGAGKYLYIADTNNHRIRKIEISTGEVSTLAGSGQNGFRDGKGTDAVLSFPEYVTMAADGKLFFSEVGSQRIKYLDPESATVITIAGSGERGFKNGSRFNAEFNNPKGLLAVGNSLYVADNWNDLIRKIDIEGNPPYADPAPWVSSVWPTNKYKVAGNVNDTKALEVSGKDFRHGAKAKFGAYEANATYVKSSDRVAVEIPFGKMPPGYYDVTVTNIDGQFGRASDAFIVLNADGSMPDKALEPAEATSQFFAYREDFRGGYTLTAGNLFPRGTGEIITGLLDGFGPQVRVFDKSGALKSQFFAFAKHLRSGVRVTACDLNGDGYDEIVTGAGKTGRPHIRIFNGYGEPTIGSGFFALDKEFKGGVNLACGDVTGNGHPEIIVAASQGGGPHVTVHRPRDGFMIANFMAYGKTFRGGIKLASVDMNGDIKKEIVTGPEFGAPHVQMFDVGQGIVKRLNPGFYAFHPNFRGGLSVAGGDVNANGKDELMVSQRTGGQAWVKIYNSKDQAILKTFLAYHGSFQGGTVVAASDVDTDGKAEILTVPGSEGSPQVRVFDFEKL